MIHIDIEAVIENLDKSWINSASAATQALLAATDDVARKEILEKNGDIWAKIKNVLSVASFEKCWYCETRNIGSDNAVDHFRPKGRVNDDTTHPGYWWLAFDARNYRFTCTFCNSIRRSPEGTAGGKQDHFPLANGSTRATDTSADLHDELPLLLDPCDPVDPYLLWFDVTGEVMPNSARSYMPFAKERAEASRNIYHLNRMKLVEERKRVVRNINRQCQQADMALSRFQREKRPADRVTFLDRVSDIRKLISPDSEFSATALCALKSNRQYQWTDMIVSVR